MAALVRHLLLSPFLSLRGQPRKHRTGNNTALQGQEVQSLDISGTCFHPRALHPSLYLLFQVRVGKLRDGWAERCKGFSKSEQSLTAALPEERKQKSHLYL